MVTPALPPYPGVTADQAQCIAQQAQRFEVPELLLHAVRRKEGGKLGDNIARKFGNSRDMGPSQINSIWLSHFKKYGVQAGDLIANFCINLQASAYVLKTYFFQSRGNWQEAVISYNIGPYNQTPERRRIGTRYMRDVMADWNQLHRYAQAHQAHVECFYRDPANPSPDCSKEASRVQAHTPKAVGVFEAPAAADAAGGAPGATTEGALE